MVRISRANQRFEPLKKPSLADANILERYDLQEYIFNSHEAFCEEVGQPQLKIIAKEVRPSKAVDDRIDLLAVDEDGDLVVIELKRGSDKLQLLQSIAYAGMAAKLTPDQIFQEAAAWSRDDMILDFKQSPELLNRTQRVVLVAEDYDYEVLVTAEWLYAKNVEIDCVRVELAVDGEAEYLTFVQVFPAPQLAEQARKRGRGSAPPMDTSWDEALADISNKAVAGFFQSHLQAGVSEKLKYREIDFPPENRIHVYLHRTYASVVQWCSRFPGDIQFWQSRINPPEGIREWSKAHPKDCLRFQLTTEENFAAFEKALNDPALRAAAWINTVVDTTQVATA